MFVVKSGNYVIKFGNKTRTQLMDFLRKNNGKKVVSSNMPDISNPLICKCPYDQVSCPF